MVRLLTFILIASSLTTFGQTNDSLKTKFLVGRIIDKCDSVPVPFASIKYNDKATISDFDGLFSLKYQDTILHLKIKSLGMLPKEITLHETNDTIQILISCDTTPTRYNEFFTNCDRRTYYKSGKAECEFAQGNIRCWFETGQLKSLTISTSDIHSITEWYENGQKKSEGSEYFGYNPGKNYGEWIKSIDWKYWDRNGNLLKKD